ncbi:MAG: methyltransferase domain-containing protein [Acidimicrobiia bacterium]
MPVREDKLVAAQYFTAVAGFAAMRHLPTHPSAVRDRLTEISAVIEHADEFPNNLEIPVVEYDLDEGYRAWAPGYDGPNPAIEADTPVVHEILQRAPRGRALDAACGTGRLAAHLDGLGYGVVGVDRSEAMLDIARAKVPGASFRTGNLLALPVDDVSVDVVTCGLALCHVIDLEPVLAEFARVVRPGGWVVISDIHPMAIHLGGAALFPVDTEGFELHYVPDMLHEIGEYVRAAIGAGLEIQECHEPTFVESGIVTNPAYAVMPEAVRQAFTGLPAGIVWRLVRR